MGDVYKARDTRLDRDVAIKVLPAHLSADEQAKARFEREAKAVAALSHPNILAIHDIGEARGISYAVTELLEGETLRASLMDGRSLAPRKAVDLGVQIARGLAAAHDRGIVHRDLKPENIFITAGGQVKILDFGLARVAAAPARDGSLRTELQATDPGTVMGTVGYMSPEQVKGLTADARSDIFSFGCVLFEMLAGARPFQRETTAETMTAILRDEPRAATPVGAANPIGAVVRHCLEKLPDDRFQSARDLGFALQSATSSTASGAIAPAGVPAPARRLIWWGAMAIGLAVATGAAVWWTIRARPAPPIPVVRAVIPLETVTLPSVGKDDRQIAVSPDGRSLAYVGLSRAALMLRDLETGQERPLVQGGEIGEPFFSPDGQFVGFVQGSGGAIRTAVWGAIKKVAVSGGAATVVASGIIGIKGADWGDDDWIYYCPAPAMGLWRVRASGGAPPEKLTDPDVSRGEKTHRRPFVLRGGRAVLFVVGTSRMVSFDEGQIEVLQLRDRSRHRLVEGGTAPRVLPTGHLVYEHAGQLLALPFDERRLAVRGAPVIIAEGIQDLPVAGTSQYDVSMDGTLFFVPRTPPPSATIVAIDRQGNATKVADAPFAVAGGSLSPDGRRLAIDPDGATQQIAIIDLTRNSMQRVTYEWDNATPIWTPDGSRLVFRSDPGGGLRRLFWQAADGSGTPELLSQGTKDEIPASISGRMLVYEDLDPTTKNDLWIMSLDDRKPHALVRTPFDESGARFSPDGRWIAYQSNQSGEWEIYVQAYPASSGRLQVSQGGGLRVLWQPDSRSLMYLRGNDVMSVSISPAGPGAPVRLFGLELSDVALDVMHDGRLLVLRRRLPPPPRSLTVVFNWFDQVRRRGGR
jgi:Tol biopolymer transport system component